MSPDWHVEEILYLFKLPNIDANLICLMQCQLCATYKSKPCCCITPDYFYPFGASTHPLAAMSVGG